MGETALSDDCSTNLLEDVNMYSVLYFRGLDHLGVFGAFGSFRGQN